MNDDENLPLQDDDPNTADPDHPASVEQCDHLDCEQPSPGRQRICDECDPIMRVPTIDECSFCGTSVTD